MSRKGYFLEGFFFGTIAGILIGILYAPDTGENTRTKIKKVKDDNQDLLCQTKGCTEKLITKTIDAIEDGFERVTNYVETRKTKPKKNYYRDNDKFSADRQNADFEQILKESPRKESAKTAAQHDETSAQTKAQTKTQTKAEGAHS